MTAELLRRAASKAREVAEAATPGRWGIFGMTVLASTDGTRNVDTAVEVAQALTTDAAGRPRTWDAAHIALWSPDKALAVADLLDGLAAEGWSNADYANAAGTLDAALAVARLLLGEAS